jgi:hypothetical protein
MKPYLTMDSRIRGPQRAHQPLTMVRHQVRPQSSIFESCQLCLEFFQRLCDIIQRTTPEEGRDCGYDREQTQATVRETHIRFKSWATSRAALHKGSQRTSLDWRLKDATEIRQRLLKILSNLLESLHSGMTSTYLLFRMVLT